MLSDRDVAFVKAIRQAVKDKGKDFTYFNSDADAETGDCVYFDAVGCPSCLIGYGLAGAGITKLDIIQLFSSGSGNFSNAESVLSMLNFHEIVTVAADYAQQKQDRNEEWGCALEEFESVLKENNIIVD